MKSIGFGKKATYQGEIISGEIDPNFTNSEGCIGTIYCNGMAKRFRFCSIGDGKKFDKSGLRDAMNDLTTQLCLVMFGCD